MADPDYEAHLAGIRRMEEGRILSAAERVMARVSEPTRQTVARRTRWGGFGSVRSAAAGVLPEAQRLATDPTGLGSMSRAGSRAAGTALEGVFQVGRDVAGQVAYNEAHPFIGGFLGPSPFYPQNPAQGDRGPSFNGYRANDQFNIIRRMNTEQVTRLQDRLVRLGFADAGDIVPGQLNDEFIAAFETVLTIANREGRTWDLVLADVEQAIKDGTYDPSTAGGRDRQPFVAPTYLAPDYATLAQTVKSQLRQSLGREPDESEMALLTAELAGWDRDAFDAEVAASRQEFDAAEAGRAEPGVIQSVDPISRFKESFEQKFKGEIRGIERAEEAQEQSEVVRGAVSTLSQMSGGMG